LYVPGREKGFEKGAQDDSEKPSGNKGKSEQTKAVKRTGGDKL